jgi:hypothetical protein
MNSKRLFALARPVVLGVVLGGIARAQTGVPVFSINWRSPTVSIPDSFTATPITEGDILAPAFLTPMIGPMPQPGIVESGGFNVPVGLKLPLHPGCVGHTGGTPCSVEVDALSHAIDPLVQCSTNPMVPPPTWAFSVSFRAIGYPGSPLFPNVLSESACGEEGADVFHTFSIPCGPIPPVPPFGNNGLIDGNGLASCSGAVYPGIGLIEPAPGDDLDALDLDLPDQWVSSTTCTYFSLDSAFFDPVLGVFNSGSAAANGFVGGDVLVTCPSCSGPSVYASAIQLGLDFGGPDTDDLDALVLRENGIPGYQRSTSPYDWVSGASDELFFSVRRGSWIIGQPDAFFGVPIEPGDILVPGPVGSLPGIWVSAEALGLATARSVPGVPIGDDLDALDALHDPWPGTSFCFGDGSGTPCPCANFGAPGRGCGNSMNPLGGILWANGFASISNDTVHFTVSGLTNPNPALTILVQGTGTIAGGMGAQFGDGLRCLSGATKRLYKRNLLCGNREYGFTVPGDLQVSVAGLLSGPGPMNYQVWYRNGNPTFCTSSTLNFTNAYRIVWTP